MLNKSEFLDLLKREKVKVIVSLFVFLGVIIFGCFVLTKSQELKKDSLSEYIFADKTVTSSDFKEFLEHCSLERKKLLLLSLCKTSGEKEKKAIEDKAIIFSGEIEKEACWVSSHWVTYKFKDFDYHETVKWVAKKTGVEKAECEYATTFQLEHSICEKLFARMWDKLSVEQRKTLLKDAGFSSSDIPGIAAVGGGAAVLALGAAANLAGFSFYILMAKTLVPVVSAITGATAATTITAVSVLCGPVGWAIGGCCLVGGSLAVGRADVDRTTAFVVQVHLIKIDAMKKSGIDCQDYFLKR